MSTQDKSANDAPTTNPTFAPDESLFLGRIPDSDLHKLSVLVPFYNERLTLGAVLEQLSNLSLELELEIIAVDDGSTDGSWKILQDAAQRDQRIIALRHDVNQGKGAAIRTAIEHITGDITIIQDADLEYNPEEFDRLLDPLLAGHADAVYGSRFAGYPCRVLYFWHAVANRMLTTFSNMVNDQTLTDMETCYKAIRTDVLKNLILKSKTFTIEPELTTRLAQWGARVYEVPISYRGRTVDEGKKIRAIDGVKALGRILWTRFFDTRFTRHTGFYTLSATSRSDKYNRWIFKKIGPFLGKRLLEAGAGIGNMSKFFLAADRLVLADFEPLYLSRLRIRFAHLADRRVLKLDLTEASDFEAIENEQLDTIFCSNVVEHIEDDEAVLDRFHHALEDGGHAIIVVPACPRIFSDIDAKLGHYRRYTKKELVDKMSRLGFDIVHAEQFNKLGTLSWYVSGKILGRKSLSPGQMIWFDRILGVAKLLEYCLPLPGMSLIVVGQKNRQT